MRTVLVLVSLLGVAGQVFAADAAIDRVGQHGGGVTAIAAEPPYLYLGCAGSLQILRAAGETYEEVSSTFTDGTVNDIALKDGVIALAAGTGGVRVMHTANPAHPATVFTYGVDGTVNDIQWYGDYLYAAWSNTDDTAGGLLIIDVSQPLAPVFAGSYAGNAAGKVTAGNGFAFLIEKKAELYMAHALTVLDTANPAAPAVMFEVAEGPTQIVPLDDNLAVVERFGYMAGLVAFEPNLTKVGDVAYTYVWQNMPDMQWAGICLNNNAGVLQWNETEAIFTEIVSNVSLEGQTPFLRDNMLFVPDNERRFAVMELTEPVFKVVYSEGHLFGFTSRTASVDDDILAVPAACGDWTSEGFVFLMERAKVTLYDVSEPSDPIVAGTIDHVFESIQQYGYCRFNAAISDDTAYLQYSRGLNYGDPRAFEAFDISDPANPQLLYSVKPTGICLAMTARDQAVYAVMAGEIAGLAVFDGSPDGGFKKLDFVTLPDFYTYYLPDARMIIEGDRLYIAASADYALNYYVFDISNPSRVSLIYSTSSYACCEDYSLAFWGKDDMVYHLGNNTAFGIMTTDISDPLLPVNRGFFPLGELYTQYLNYINAAGFIYDHMVTAGANITQIDISDPDNLTLVAKQEFPGYYPHSCIEHNGYVYVVDRTQGVHVYTEHRFPLTLAAQGSGTITPEPGTSYADEGAALSIEATPAPNWRFSHWTGDVAAEYASNNPLAFVMPARAAALTAVFEEVTYQLEITKEGGGYTDPLPGPHAYLHDTTVTVQAIPDPGWRFDRWEGEPDGDWQANPATVTMTGDKALRAVFVPIGVPVTMAVGPAGGGITYPAPGTREITAQSSLTLAALPEAGWRFDHWEAVGAEVPEGNPATVTITGEATFTAVFARITHTLTLSTEGEGTLNPAIGAHVFNYGTTVMIEAIPADGWRFAGWEHLGAKSAPEPANPLPVTMTGDLALRAHFVRIEEGLTILVRGMGATTPAPGNYQYAQGDHVTLTATPDENWMFSYWEGVEELPQSTSIDLVIFGNQVVTAVFVPRKATLTLAVTGEGTTTPATGAHIYDPGDTAVLYAQAADGWRFAHWEGTPADQASANPASFTITADMAVTAVFEEDGGWLDCAGGNANTGEDLGILGMLAALLFLLKKK